ncbi:MAG TPA: selenocysteine-specific translation elongation factor [Anaerolineae bacterium]|nr:selenocysteine-specific translation elongation factor [Anaerolineae bacterium]
MYVIGTAGHVDHGKSTLVKALTGINPDRLKEEQEREMTIDLGFAWLKLPNGEEVGIVDVPGHRDFIENMLAGVGGIDAVLFVVDAGEGVMPQTKEHLAIMDLLNVKSGIVALTKVDLIKEPEWLELVESDIYKLLGETGLSQAPIIRVSAVNGEGLNRLKHALEKCLQLVAPHRDLDRPRLPIDRVFTIKGFGTVVTGTLLDGKLKVGEEVQILPSGVRGRIRGLQTHKQKEEVAIPGSRTAVNISGVEVNQLKRGDILTYPDYFHITSRFDAKLWVLPDAYSGVKHNDRLKIFIGAAEYIGRVRVIGKELIVPGDDCLVQIEFSDTAIAVRGDRFIIRRPSPAETLGGGVVLDSHPVKRYKRFSEVIINHLCLLASGSLEDILLENINSAGTIEIKDCYVKLAVSPKEFLGILDTLIKEQQVILLEMGLITTRSPILITTQSSLQKNSGRLMKEVNAFHERHPLRQGIRTTDLRNRLKMTPRVFRALMNHLLYEDRIKESEDMVYSSQHDIVFSTEQLKDIEALNTKFDQQPYAPPTQGECREIVGEDIYLALIDLGKFMPVSNEIILRKREYEEMVQGLIAHLKSQETISLAEFRDKYHTSRRYALAFLEHMDEKGITVREGEVRKLKKPLLTH